jgi:hypothetical protein
MAKPAVPQISKRGDTRQGDNLVETQTILGMAPGRDHDDFYRASGFFEFSDPLCKRKMDEVQQRHYYHAPDAEWKANVY